MLAVHIHGYGMAPLPPSCRFQGKSPQARQNLTQQTTAMLASTFVFIASNPQRNHQLNDVNKMVDRDA